MQFLSIFSMFFSSFVWIGLVCISLILSLVHTSTINEVKHVPKWGHGIQHHVILHITASVWKLFLAVTQDLHLLWTILDNFGPSRWWNTSMLNRGETPPGIWGQYEWCHHSRWQGHDLNVGSRTLVHDKRGFDSRGNDDTQTLRLQTGRLASSWRQKNNKNLQARAVMTNMLIFELLIILKVLACVAYFLTWLWWNVAWHLWDSCWDQAGSVNQLLTPLGNALFQARRKSFAPTLFLILHPSEQDIYQQTATYIGNIYRVYHFHINIYNLTDFFPWENIQSELLQGWFLVLGDDSSWAYLKIKTSPKSPPSHGALVENKGVGFLHGTQFFWWVMTGVIKVYQFRGLSNFMLKCTVNLREIW